MVGDIQLSNQDQPTYYISIMSTEDLTDTFEPLARSPRDYKYLTAIKIQDGLIINDHCTYDIFETNEIDCVPVKVIAELEDNFPDSSLEPPTDAFSGTTDNLLLEEHNYALKDLNTQMPKTNLELALLMQNSCSHKCEFCNKIFANITSLRRHVRSHTKEKPYQCKVCDKRFSQQSNLWKHIRVHTGERPFECPQCKRKFSQRANMKKHMMIHSGEKPYECPHCWRCFTQLANLNKHILLHIGTQPYKCKYCDKRFFQLSNMRKHEYVHEGIKPYSCSYCRVSYSQHSNLKKHLAMHANEQVNVCGECGKSFIKKENLTKHQKYCTGEIFDPIDSLFDFETNKYIKIVQTDGSHEKYYISEENITKLEDDVEVP